MLYIRGHAYNENTLILGIDIEHDLVAGFMGLTILAGDLQIGKLKYAKPAAGGAIYAQHVADIMHIVFRYDHILEIHDAGLRALTDRPSYFQLVLQ